MNKEQTLEDLNAFSEAQQKVIIQLNKKIQKLEAEKNNLEELLKKSPLATLNTEITLSNDMASEEAICMIQIKRLEEISLARELTYEETKKLEIFNKIILSKNNKQDSLEVKSRSVEDGELLKIVENGNDRKQQS